MKFDLTDFLGADSTNVATPTEAIYMANIRLSAIPGPGAGLVGPIELDTVVADTPAEPPVNSVAFRLYELVGKYPECGVGCGAG